MTQYPNRNLTVLILTVILFVVSAAQQESPVPGLEEYITKGLKEWEVPGVALAIVKNDQVIYAKGFGVRRMGENAPITEETVFAVASTTKAMTAACLGMLVDEKRISWDDPATKHLKGFQLYDPYVTREITIRDLLTHRIGLDRGDALWWSSPYSRAEVLERIRYLKPGTSFRSQYGYQNIMYLAAGEIVPAVTDTSWDDFILERLFKPLGMSASSSRHKDLNGVENIATPHGYIDGKLTTIEWVNVDNIGPAGSVSSNALDMAQWIRMNLNEGSYEGRRIVSADVIREMQRPQMLQRLDSLTQALRPTTHFVAYGLGWTLYDYLGRKIATHDGALHGMRTRVVLVPEENLGFVILMNSTRGQFHWSLAFRILDHYLGGKERDWLSVYLDILKDQLEKGKAAEKKRSDERVKGTKPSLALDQYVGVYENEMYGSVTVTQEKGKPVLEFYPGFVGDLNHWHYETFEIVYRNKTHGKSTIIFAMNSSGKVESAKFGGLGEFVKKK